MCEFEAAENYLERQKKKTLKSYAFCKHPSLLATDYWGNLGLMRDITCGHM